MTVPSEAAMGKAMFAELRPLCVAVMSSPTCGNLSELRAGIEGLPTTGPLPPPLVYYVLLPLRTAIKKYANSDAGVLEGALLSVAALLSRSSELTDWDLFKDLYTFLSLLLDTRLSAEAGISGCGSEEVLQAAMTMLSSLLLSHSASIIKQLYSEPISVGHCISVLISHASNPAHGHALRLAALSALSAIAGLDVHPLLRLVDQLQATPTDDEKTTPTGAEKATPTDAETVKPTDDEKTTPTDGMKFSPAVTNFISGMERVGQGPEWAGSVLRSFLPGLCSSITKMIASDKTTATPLIIHGLITWAHYVGVVMSGEATPTSWTTSSDLPSPQSSYLPSALTSRETMKTKEGKSLLVDRDAAWERATATRLHVLVQRLAVLVTSDTWKSRLFLVGWAYCLIAHTHRVLEGCVPQLVEVLVTLSHDQYGQVSSSAQLALVRFPAGDHTLSSLLGSQLHTLVSSLPRLIRHHDDTRKMSTLQLLAGYLQLSGSHVTLMIHSMPHLTRLVQALLEVLTVEVWSQPVLATPLPELDPFSLSLAPLRLCHAHFHSDKVAALLKEVCQLLGCHGDLPVLLDYVLDQFRLSSRQHNELLLLMAYLMPRGGPSGSHGNIVHGSRTSEELISLVEDVVGVVIDEGVWSSTENSDLRRYLLINLVHTCVHIVGVACEPMLQVILYPLMLRLQDDNEGVASAAMATLGAICHHCRYRGVADLVEQNADYLVHKISEHLRLRYSTKLRPSLAVKVLQSVVSHGDEGVCLLIRDVLDELILSLDLQQLEAELVWEGLDAVARNCVRWVELRKSEGCAGGEEGAEEVGVANEKRGIVKGSKIGGDRKEDELEHEDIAGKGVGLEAIGEFFRNYHKQKAEKEEAQLGGSAKEEEEGPAEEGGTYSQDEEKLPCCESVSVEVLRRCVHHMSHPVAMVRMKVLAAVRHCLRALQSHKLSLYPEVHQVWEPLLPRLSDHAPPVAREAWQVIGCMSAVAGDFLRKRVLEKVWPLLISTLETMATDSLKADALYKQSVRCKVQVSMLECVGQISSAFSLPSLSLEGGAVGVTIYLHDEQPEVLQEAAVGVARKLIVVNADIMWLVLSQLSPSAAIQATPPQGLTPFKFHSHAEAGKYFKNVQKLLPLTLLS